MQNGNNQGIIRTGKNKKKEETRGENELWKELGKLLSLISAEFIHL